MTRPTHRGPRKMSNSERYILCNRTKEADCLDCQVKIISGSLIYHMAMTMIKGVVGVITGSKVLVAEAVHSFSDCAAFGINYFGARGKTVSVPMQSILIGIIMFVSGVWICSDNFAIIISRIPSRPGLFALIVAKVSILVNAHLYLISLCNHKRDRSNANVFIFMIQNKTNLFAACFGFFGILLAVLGLVYFDPIGALFIGGFQIHGALQIFAEYFEKEKAKVAALKKQMVLALGALTVCIIVFFSWTVLCTFSRRDVVLIPSEGGTLDSPVSSLLGRAPYFCIVDLKNGTTTMKMNKSRYYNVEESGILGAMVNAHNIGTVLAGKVGPKMFTALRGDGVRIYYFENAATVSGAVSDFQSGRLRLAASANASTGFGRTQVRWLGPW